MVNFISNARKKRYSVANLLNVLSERLYDIVADRYPEKKIKAYPPRPSKVSLAFL